MVAVEGGEEGSNAVPQSAADSVAAEPRMIQGGDGGGSAARGFARKTGKSIAEQAQQPPAPPPPPPKRRKKTKKNEAGPSAADEVRFASAKCSCVHLFSVYGIGER